MDNLPKKIGYLVVDTSAFLQNASLQDIAENVMTCQEVVNEITSKRQLRRLVVLPYDLQIKNVHPENIQAVTEFSKKTGDYPSLSATDIKVMALTYQIEKEKVGTNHIRTEPLHRRTVNIVSHKKESSEITPNMVGFFVPKSDESDSDYEDGSDEAESELDEGNENSSETLSVENNTNEKKLDGDLEELKDKFQTLNCESSSLDVNVEDVLKQCEKPDEYWSENDEGDDNDDGWITPSNIKAAKKEMQGELVEEKEVKVACMTTDFAMQNVLKQMNLNVAALDGKVIKQLRTFILRCYTCFKTTSVMTKQFCPKCGNNTLKKVSVSLDQNGKMQIHINGRKPLTARGKKFSLPRIKGGKHPNNPILVADQPMPDNRPSRLARTKNNPLDDDYIAGFSPFVMRDINSKSAQLGIRPGQEIKHWMRKNPNEARRKRK